LNKGEYISSNQACPTHEAWLAYAENRCNKQQERAMETHLMDCPLCADAVEMYMGGHGETIQNIQQYVKQNIDNQSIVKIVPIWKRFAPFALAASLLLGFFFFKYNKNENQVEQIAQQDKQIAPILDSTELTLTEKETAADAASVEEKHKNPPKTTVEKQEDIAVVQANENYNISSKQENIAAPPSVVADAVTATEKETVPYPASMTAKKKTSENTKTSNANSNSTLTIANDYFKNRNYEKTVETCKIILTEDAKNQEALFLLGKSEVARGFYQNALVPLESVNSPIFYNEAQWELAQAYVKSNKISKAKRILKALSEKENQFQENAKAMLKNLE
jgi:hypothetical protein